MENIMNRMNEDWQTIPEWPRGYRRGIRNIYIAIHHPNYTGRFKKFAFPYWYRNLRKFNGA
jgi:hypothetical protein